MKLTTDEQIFHASVARERRLKASVSVMQICVECSLHLNVQ